MLFQIVLGLFYLILEFCKTISKYCLKKIKKKENKRKSYYLLFELFFGFGSVMVLMLFQIVLGLFYFILEFCKIIPNIANKEPKNCFFLLRSFLLKFCVLNIVPSFWSSIIFLFYPKKLIFPPSFFEY